MKNKIFYSILVTSTAAINSLLAVNPVNTSKHTFYSGIAFGYSYAHTNISDQFNYEGFPQTLRHDKASARKSGIEGGLKLGYRNSLKSCLVNLEIALTKDTNKFKKDFQKAGIYSHTKVNSNYAIQPTIGFGKNLNEKWIGFIKVGPTFKQFKISHTRTIGNVSSNDSFRKTRAGLLIGLSGEYALTNQVSATAEVAHERYKKYKMNYAMQDFSAGSYHRGQIKPHYTTVKVGMIYRFNACR